MSVGLALFGAFLVGGCIARVPDDVSFVSLELVKKGEADDADLLKVEFTSSMDLARFATENSYVLGVNAYFCDRPDELVLMAHPFIYWRGWRLGLERTALLQGAQDLPITYHVFLDLEGRQMKSYDQGNPYRAFDLANNPQDVCFQLAGGSVTGFGFGYRSNKAVIPKATIEAALRDLQVRS